MKQLIRSELRKLTTTNMPWAFLGALFAIAAINAFAVIAATDFDGSKTFISTEVDQQSLVAFAANGFVLASLFGAIAVAREYGHHTVVPTFLAAPRRHRAVLAQVSAVAVGGAVFGVGIGAVVRNVGGAVTGVVLMLIVAPPLIVQLANSTASWMPNSLALVLAGVTTDVSDPAAVAALSAWALVPAGIGLVAVQRRDVI